MNSTDSSKVAKSLGELVEHAVHVRQEWIDRHAEEGTRDKERADDWAATKPFWKPWFRGHEDANWTLQPKLYRANQPSVEKLFEFEEELRADFKRRGSQLAEGLNLPAYQDDWGCYSLMQHYGAPTRILDWSDGALTALYFAVRGTQKDAEKVDACVWMLDPYRLNCLTFYPPDDRAGVALPDWPAAKQYLPELFTGEELLREYPLAIDPPHGFRRLSSQRGHFTVFGTHLYGLDELKQRSPELLERITIPSALIPIIKSDFRIFRHFRNDNLSGFGGT